jgi:hypothetical protein
MTRWSVIQYEIVLENLKKALRVSKCSSGRSRRLVIGAKCIPKVTWQSQTNQRMHRSITETASKYDAPRLGTESAAKDSDKQLFFHYAVMIPWFQFVLLLLHQIRPKSKSLAGTTTRLANLYSPWIAHSFHGIFSDGLYHRVCFSRGRSLHVLSFDFDLLVTKNEKKWTNHHHKMRMEGLGILEPSWTWHSIHGGKP